MPVNISECLCDRAVLSCFDLDIKCLAYKSVWVHVCMSLNLCSSIALRAYMQVFMHVWSCVDAYMYISVHMTVWPGFCTWPPPSGVWSEPAPVPAAWPRRRATPSPDPSSGLPLWDLQRAHPVLVQRFHNPLLVLFLQTHPLCWIVPLALQHADSRRKPSLHSATWEEREKHRTWQRDKWLQVVIFLKTELSSRIYFRKLFLSVKLINRFVEYILNKTLQMLCWGWGVRIRWGEWWQ